ncbi:MAG: hypothetical protein JSR83_10140 [Proteobacteria bacterium]|nr:hypothetical protein [Pseudomonadota bacterium]
MNLSDQELHAKAQSYARENRVSYAEALSAVVVSFSSTQVQPMTAAYSEGGLSDAEIDQRAKVYAREHSVSYAEALTQVCTITTCFREGGAIVAFSEAAQIVEGQWIDIFRAGEHIDDSGVSHRFSQADVAGMAAFYNPALREAPLVIGHPETDGPAHGWVAGLRATPDGMLQMKPSQVEARFAEQLRAGRFKKRSAAFYPPNHPGNPSPGKWYLRHVGFLGAQPPAVAGLRDLAFS